MDLGLFYSTLRSPQTMPFPVGSEKNVLGLVEKRGGDAPLYYLGNAKL